jgi:hypothetical protein
MVPVPLQVEALQSSRLVRSVAENTLLRSAYRTSGRIGAFADDVLMSAMKSARKQLLAPHERQ